MRHQKHIDWSSRLRSVLDGAVYCRLDLHIFFRWDDFGGLTTLYHHTLDIHFPRIHHIAQSQLDMFCLLGCSTLTSFSSN
jgi:hypothetical protein